MEESKNIDFTPLKPDTYELKCISEEQFEGWCVSWCDITVCRKSI